MKQIDKKFHVNGTHASVVRIDPEQLRDSLPAGIYNVGFNPFTGFFLELRKNRFEVPETLFGEINQRVDSLFKRYEKFGDVSALLSGSKGAGKTLLAHIFANKAMDELGKAVILVDNSFENPNGLKDFLVDIGDAVFLFDEFAKNFSGDEQAGMLDFFSGSNAGKRATFVIENRYTDVNEFMLDRPGRVKFHYRYTKLSMETVTEVCQHFELSPTLTKLIQNYAARSLTIGMDTLSRLIEECVFDEIDNKDAFNALVADLNIPTNKEFNYKIVDVEFEGKKITPVGLNNLSVSGNGKQLYGNLYRCENHPIAKALLESKNEKVKAIIDSISYETRSDEDEDVMVREQNWYDMDLRCNRPTFSLNGELIFIHKDTGLKFTVAEEDDMIDGDFTLLV